MYHFALFGSFVVFSALAAPTKVLPLGDSVTLGCGDQCRFNCMKIIFPDCAPCAQGWRGPLWRKLAGNSTTSTKWDFVGTQTNGDATSMDVHHEGHSGWKNEGILGIMDNWAPLNPDVIMLHLGTNNMGIGLQTAETALGHMDDLLNATFKRLPNVRLLLSTIIGASRVTYFGGKHAAYNIGIKAFVKQYAAAGHDIELVDMEKDSGIGQYCDSTNCCPLGIHPKNVGYERMAEVWYEHLTKASTTKVVV